MRINTNALMRRPAHKNYNYIQPVNDCHQCYKLLSVKTVIQKVVLLYRCGIPGIWV